MVKNPWIPQNPLKKSYEMEIKKNMSPINLV